MLKKLIIIISYGILFTALPYARAADGDSLWKKVSFIIDTLQTSPADKLQKLLNIETEKNKTGFRQDSAYGYLLSSIGQLYFKQGEYFKGAQYYRRSIDLVGMNIGKPWINPDHLIMCYYRLNTIYDSLNRVSEEMRALDSCISIARRRGTVNKFSVAALYKRAEYLFDVGDYNSCIHYAEMCEMQAKMYTASHDKNDNYGIQYAYSSLLWNVLAQIVLKNYDIAESLLKTKLNESIKTGISFDLGTIYNHLAEVQRAKGNIQEALIYYNKALKEESKAGHDISCKAILNTIGYTLFQQKDVNRNQAILYYRKALAIVNRDKKQAALNSIETLNILANIGELYAQKGLYDSALSYYQLALDEIKPGINEAELLQSQFDEFARQKKMSYITGLLLNKGDAFFQLYKEKGGMSVLKEAIRVYKVTDQLLDRIKREQFDVHSKLFWRTDSRRLYEHAIEACYNDRNTDDAFYFFEKSRAVLLNDQLNEQRWLGEGDIQKQTQIRKKILKLENALDTADKNSNRFHDLQNELFGARQESNQLVEIIKARDPLYYQSFIDLKVLTIADVKNNILSDHQALIEIFAGDSAVYVLTIKADQVNIIKVNRSDYDSLSRSYLSYLSNATLINSRFEEFVSVSKSLYQLIFRNEKLPRGRIIISPDGEYFPFESLVKGGSGNRLNYFLNEYAVSYTYSAKYLLNKFVTQTDSKSPVFLGVAPVKYPSVTQLSTLTGSDHSLMQLQSHFSNTSNLVLSDATRGEFMSRYSKYRIIQLYTHAVDSGKNGEPVIYFFDSALNLSALLGEDKPVTRLVVLSACESAKGKLFKGEGVFSFNRGFAALGIPSSISNLWSVDDRATYRLTEFLYKYISSGLPIDVALQKAKLEFLETAEKNNQLPYYWAATILIGKTNEIDTSTAFPWKTLIWFIAALTFVSGLIFFRIEIKNKNNKI
ncbi:MAG TPA: CHAT domain-containing tetratricopeptide repeat protein [Puia sp.]|nr:CHAT domain-containing tetratricopeptide repeat protein [Puia sp.]